MEGQLGKIIHRGVETLRLSKAEVSPSFVRSFIRLFVRSFVCSFVHSFVRSFVRSYVRSFVRSFVCSFILSCVPSFPRTSIFYVFISCAWFDSTLYNEKPCKLFP